MKIFSKFHEAVIFLCQLSLGGSQRKLGYRPGAGNAGPDMEDAGWVDQERHEFELNRIEKAELVTNCDRLNSLKHSNTTPFVFTEQGVAMLSSVLHSGKAIRINIEIMRAFARYRTFLHETEELRKELHALNKKFTQAFNSLLERLDELHQKKNLPRTRIGFRKDDL